MNKKLFLILIICTLVFSCGNFILDSDPKNTPENNFEIFWKEFDRYYAFFNLRNINWDSVYTAHRPYVNPETSGQELFQIFSSMLNVFRDVHVNLYTPLGSYAYKRLEEQHYQNFDHMVVNNEYLKDGLQSAGNYMYSYGRLENQLGYLLISTFSGNEDIYKRIDYVFLQLSWYQVKGLIIDIRDNAGGNTAGSDYIASRFADKKRLYEYVRWRNGPGHSDFTELTPHYVEPSEKAPFKKPVAVLINRNCFSTAEAFVLAMKTFPNVITIGDTTGGGAGNPIMRELPNGWVYRIPRWISYTPELKCYEGVGIAPDIKVDISYNDSRNRKDPILDKAIEILKENMF